MKRTWAEGKPEIFELKDNNGSELTNRSKMREITEQFSEELYTSGIEQIEYDTLQAPNHQVLNQSSEDLPNITIEESRNALKEMKKIKPHGKIKF